MKRCDTLDILKYLACFLVIIIHMDIPMSFEPFIQPLLTAAVPVFFMITGFFYKNIKESGSEKKQIKKIVILTLIANLIHILWCCFKLAINGESILSFVAEALSLEALVNLIVFNQPIWRTSIWYINALLFVLVLIYAVTKRYDLQKIYFLIPVLIILNLVLGTYSFFIPGSEDILLCYSRNFLFCGLPYFLLGSYVFTNKEKIYSLYGRWWCVVAFWLLGCVELWGLRTHNMLNHSDHIASSFFLSLSLFCCFANGSFVIGVFWTKIARLGRKYSFIIYVSHSIIIEILYKIIYAVEFPILTEIFGYVGPLIVLATSTLLAYLTVRYKNRFLLLVKS